MLELPVFDVDKRQNATVNNCATSAVAIFVTNWHNVKFHLHKHLRCHTLAYKKIEINIRKI